MEEMIVDTKQAKKDFYYVGVCLFVGMLVSVFAQLLAGLVVALIPGLGIEATESPLFLWGMTILTIYGIGMALIIFLLKRRPGEAPEQRPISLGRFFSFLPVCFFLMYTGSIIGNFLSSLMSGGEAENVVSEALEQKHFLMYISTLVCAPVLEELVFRKLVLDRTRKYGERLALVLSAVAFGLFHMNFFQFFYAFGIGLVFGYIYLRTGKIHYTMILHAILNFVGGVVSVWVSEYTEVAPDVEMTASQNAVSFLFILFIVAMFVTGARQFWRRTGRLEWRSAEVPLPKGKVFSTAYLNLGILLYVGLCALFMALNLV